MPDKRVYAHLEQQLYALIRIVYGAKVISLCNSVVFSCAAVLLDLNSAPLNAST